MHILVQVEEHHILVDCGDRACHILVDLEAAAAAVVVVEEWQNSSKPRWSPAWLKTMQPLRHPWLSAVFWQAGMLPHFLTHPSCCSTRTWTIRLFPMLPCLWSFRHHHHHHHSRQLLPRRPRRKRHPNHRPPWCLHRAVVKIVVVFGFVFGGGGGGGGCGKLVGSFRWRSRGLGRRPD